MQTVPFLLKKGPAAVQAGALQADYPHPLFDKAASQWPDRVSVDEEFTGKLVWTNCGAAGMCMLGLEYKGQQYYVMLGDQKTFHMEAGMTIEATITSTMRQILGDLETWEKSKTVEITWLVAYVEDALWAITDRFLTAIYVEVPEGPPIPPTIAGIPWWGFALGGIGLVGLTYVVVKK